ncbi:DUF3237 domain-containing protein [Salinisphaera sp. SPP-AMP-43]|uniref:DUF3237 domain-containing protein n=1 Tax=Salinisphaera sp. SPP-AMP-43 TaxID=3121288 RepID=UPI003C6E7589
MPEAVPPILTFTCRLRVDIGKAMDLGLRAQGQRRFMPITGGTVEGPYLNGRILAGGGDWQTVRSDGVVELHAQYAIELIDGTPVEIEDRGFRHFDSEAVNLSPANGSMSSTGYYFQTSARLNAAAGSYEWLSRTVFVASAERHAKQVVIDLFALGNFRCA